MSDQQSTTSILLRTEQTSGDETYSAWANRPANEAGFPVFIWGRNTSTPSTEISTAPVVVDQGGNWDDGFGAIWHRTYTNPFGPIVDSYAVHGGTAPVTIQMIVAERLWAIASLLGVTNELRLCAGISGGQLAISSDHEEEVVHMKPRRQVPVRVQVHNRGHAKPRPFHDTWGED